MTVYLTLDNLMAMVGEAGLQAVRDVGLLDSAAQRPRTTVFGEDAYPTLDEKVAVLLESIVRNHPLIDGNKRLGWLSATVFYGINGVFLNAPEDDAYDLVIAVSTGVMSYPESAARLASWTSTST
ncbi:type II toxin-antitoxin system death-on-curing family toxin [Aeromicrobium fastidiosum]|uniref:Type II toxin-antitoxin system death-on-curing family toxin n=1 Tax=Aeromicrobium fastidiosum TaxID=52699 RepID=A0A641ARS3_9ACTN|nr:type II toxin-antitoxin system death-on-curing family toxin [Aeromicrobium fastidiosum]KAA1380217.1 type II toxin-antitoxin system death-on-curing family toxin [Aeromicrobium fastidiosum]MBP2389767.1 death-on-curing protein [Aeromicrobium fastidiosum]